MITVKTTFGHVLVLMLFCIAPSANALNSASSLGLLDSSKASLMQQDYPRATRLITAVLTKFPEIQEAYYLKCAIIQTEMLDYESYVFKGETFLKCADTVLKRLSYRLPLEKGKDSIKCLFYVGSTLGAMGIVQAKLGNWPFGIRNALASVGYYKQILKLDPEFKAAYIGVGVFDYYLSDNFKWFPLIGDKRGEAIDQMQLATEAPFPYNYAACNSFCWILIEQNQLKKADSLASQVLLSYPENTMFIRVKVRVSLACGKWKAAIIHAQRLVDLSIKRDPVNWSDVMSGYQAMVLSFDKLGMKKQCVDTTEKVLALTIPEQYRKIYYVKKHLKFITELNKRSEK